MIIPSIDIVSGRAVQLRRGRDMVLDGGDPMARLEQFAVAGEVAVIDLDAALGRGSNADLIRRMVRLAPCRVGGGIRDHDTAVSWLDAGARQIIVGTAASAEFCSRFPRERIVAAVDVDEGRVVVDGWRASTHHEPLERIAELGPTVSGILFTQVEHEGSLAGFDLELVRRAVAAAGSARVTAAGGVRSAEDIAALDRIGADAQVGMALYTDRVSLGQAVGAPLNREIDGALWPTVVCDEQGISLGLAWSTRESLQAAVDQRRGIYWSRSRDALWVKGATSGATQELVRVDLDCDRDAIKFTVRQHGSGFCHTGSRGCWPTPFSLASLERVIAERREAGDTNSGTRRLLSDPGLLESKLLEEAAELAQAQNPSEVAHETADLVYLAMVAARRGEVTVTEVLGELEWRNLRVSRRPMVANRREDSA